ncbi:unnamed protein product [Darwinula stevensoni]|uniref:Uncharacterized protein n=1 Tax=Darwinula stevensoni TaxID=69355 RepID=A0A7R8X0P6_9CRUS|nr:unnamed protein product [Darwinula stevensoni]CAG0879092.1 unnamed protein product [Darwinula stevensoni]
MNNYYVNVTCPASGKSDEDAASSDDRAKLVASEEVGEKPTIHTDRKLKGTRRADQPRKVTVRSEGPKRGVGRSRYSTTTQKVTSRTGITPLQKRPARTTMSIGCYPAECLLFLWSSSLYEGKDEPGPDSAHGGKSGSTPVKVKEKDERGGRT